MQAGGGITFDAKFKAILKAAPDAVIISNHEGYIQEFNPAAEILFGYSKAEVLGENVSMLMPEPMRSEHDSYLRRHLETGIRRVIGTIRNTFGQRRTGEVFPISLSISRVDMEEDSSYFFPKFPLFTAFIRESSPGFVFDEEIDINRKVSLDHLIALERSIRRMKREHESLKKRLVAEVGGEIKLMELLERIQLADKQRQIS